LQHIYIYTFLIEKTLLPYLLSYLHKKPVHAAVAAGFLVNFLGVFLAGAGAGAAAGFDCVVLFPPAFNFLGFFFSGAAED
jgi:hypothetical protein